MKLHPDFILRLALAVDKLDRKNPDWWFAYAGGLDACIGCGLMIEPGRKFKHAPDCPAGYLKNLLKRTRVDNVAE